MTNQTSRPAVKSAQPAAKSAQPAAQPATQSAAQPATQSASTTRQGRPAAPRFDFSKVTFAPAKAPTRHSENRFEPPAELVAQLKASWAERVVSSRKIVDGVTEYRYLGEGRKIAVPSAAAKGVVTMIRRTAASLKLGVSVSHTQDGQVVKTVGDIDESGGPVTVLFAAKTPKNYDS